MKMKTHHTPYKSVQYIVKAVLSVKFVAVNAYVKKEKESFILKHC